MFWLEQQLQRCFTRAQTGKVRQAIGHEHEWNRAEDDLMIDMKPANSGATAA